MSAPSVDGLADAEGRRRIRGELDQTFVVEAAAGTGKTTELVARIVAVLAAGADVGRIAAVTFTEKAAGELKLRLRAELDSACREAEGSAREHLEHALLHLEEARVSTIHGFCSDLLRQRPIDAGIDPAFVTLSQPESDELIAQTFVSWLTNALEDPPPGLRRALRRRGYDAPTARLLRAARELCAYRDHPTPWQRPPFDRKQAIDEVWPQVEQLADVAAAADNQRDRLAVDLAVVRDAVRSVRLASRDRPRDDDELEATLVSLATERRLTHPSSGWGTHFATLGGERIDRKTVKAMCAELTAALSAFRELADADLAAALQQELWVVVERYRDAKLATGSLDFEDLLLRLRDLLASDEAARAAFQQSLSHLFVDEFQDTDPLQAEVLLLLSGADRTVNDWREITPVPGKLFIVGDPKQAIYRFRRADVAVYRQVCAQLVARGAHVVELSTSFRSVPGIQRVVNRAFSAVMTGDDDAQQARYVALQPCRKPRADVPPVVVLPVPAPYGKRRLAKASVDKSLPDAVAAYIDWLIKESGYTVEVAGRSEALSARHICLLFRQLERFHSDATRPFVQALETRGIAHVLVGGRTLHDREEVSSLLTALTAIEWPDDDLSVYATLRGPFFGFNDETLLSWRAHVGPLRPRSLPVSAWPQSVGDVGTALMILEELHRARNRRPVADTITRLLRATRAHAGFALRPSGEQVLANVMHVSDVARAYEARGGTSFRGFVEQLIAAATERQSAEAPILEEGSDGVRMMTVHRAKGLEFPIVILTDLTTSRSRSTAQRTVDRERGLCAMRLMGAAPKDLVEREPLELLREDAESDRLGYVAATRARDQLVIPAVGDDPSYPDKSWLAPLLLAVTPDTSWERSARINGLDRIFSVDSVVDRPSEAEPARTVKPGRYRDEDLDLVWWDPHALDLRKRAKAGVRGADLLDKAADESVVKADLAAAEAFITQREATLAVAARPSANVETATERSHRQAAWGRAPSTQVELLQVPRPNARSAGARFGTLVHAVLALAAWDADANALLQLARLEGLLLGATATEIEDAATAAVAALSHPVMRRAAAADASGRCRREVGLTLRGDHGEVIEGVVDLAFEEDGAFVVVDFKTDRDVDKDLSTYEHQVALYAEAITRATGQPTRGYLLSI